MSWIQGYKIQFSSPVQQHSLPKQTVLSPKEFTQFDEAISELLNIGAISTCKPCPNQFISSIFLRPKPNGKVRLILNLKNLNKHIETYHFKLEDIRTVLKLISKGSFMASLDLKDAYFLLKIDETSRKFLRFSFNNILYEFNALPFGLNTAPFIFTKVMKPVVKLLRSAGYLSSIYLDDLCLISDSYEGCLDNVETTKKLLTSLGFIINLNKSVLTPSSRCKYLGYIIDTNELNIQLPPDKRIRIVTETKKVMKMHQCKIRYFAQYVGLLVSACPAIEYGWLYTKQLERCKYLNLLGHNDYDKTMIIPTSLHQDLEWWLQAVPHSVKRIRDDHFKLEIFSDASTTGWGAACGTETASGPWSNKEREQHINLLELLAAFIALKIFAKDCTDCKILMRIDNSTAISYINRMGGIQFPHLTEITKSIWQWCEQRRIFIVASYIKSIDNDVADGESRRSHPDIEWELRDSAFKSITNNFGVPQIDLFSSRINKKCDKYISWKKDPDAFTIDAFTVNWSPFFFYAFPPFSIILKTLRKIITDGARGIVVIPMWPTQPWYPMFRRLLVSDLLIFKPNENVIISHSSKGKIHTNLTLAAGILCGRRC